MSPRERTRQQLDPAGSLAGRPLTALFAGGAFVYAAVMTIRSLQQIAHWPLAMLALIVLAAACTAVTVTAMPFRAHFGRRALVSVLALALCASTLFQASQWGTNQFLQDDWGAMALGILVLAMGPYRPAVELASMGVLAAIYIGFVTLLIAPGLSHDVPPIAFVLVSTTPVLALSFGAAAYSSGLVKAIGKWRPDGATNVHGDREELLDGIVRSVHQDRLTILGRDVIPFFNEVLEREHITDDDRQRAHRIADAIRGIMVAEADRNWLEGVVAEVDPPAREVCESSAVSDEDDLASMMETDQRTALRALIVALRDEPTFVANSMRIALIAEGELCRGELTARLEGSEQGVRSSLAPYFAVLRVVFTGLSVHADGPSLTVKFSYEQR